MSQKASRPAFRKLGRGDKWRNIKCTATACPRIEEARRESTDQTPEISLGEVHVRLLVVTRSVRIEGSYQYTLLLRGIVVLLAGRNRERWASSCNVFVEQHTCNMANDRKKIPGLDSPVGSVVSWPVPEAREALNLRVRVRTSWSPGMAERAGPRQRVFAVTRCSMRI